MKQTRAEYTAARVKAEVKKVQQRHATELAKAQSKMSMELAKAQSEVSRLKAELAKVEEVREGNDGMAA